MWKLTTDGRTDDGQRMITIVHLSLRLRCTKKPQKYGTGLYLEKGIHVLNKYITTVIMIILFPCWNISWKCWWDNTHIVTSAISMLSTDQCLQGFIFMSKNMNEKCCYKIAKKHWTYRIPKVQCLHVYSVNVKHHFNCHQIIRFISYKNFVISYKEIE